MRGRELSQPVKVLVLVSAIALPGVALGGHDFIFGAAGIAALGSLVIGKQQRKVTVGLLRDLFAANFK